KNGTGYSNHESPSANTWRGCAAAITGPPRTPLPRNPFTPRLFMIARVVLYSWIRFRRSTARFSSSLRRSRPTVAGDAPATGNFAALAAGALAWASARACANVTGPAPPCVFEARTDAFGLARMTRVDFA